MHWKAHLNGDSVTWLLQSDDPGVRYLALRDLADPPPTSADLNVACREAHQRGAIGRVLDRMQPEGYWAKAGAGYSPKYRSTVWAVTLLAQLGAHVSADERVGTACAYVLEHSLAQGGKFSYNGAPGGTISCLQGNLSWSLMALGCEDERLEAAVEWMVHSVTGEGVASNKERKAELRYYAYTCAPNFACGANSGQPCAWGAAKIMLAFAQLPPRKRTPLVERAIQTGVGFLMGVDPATADYPTGTGVKPSSNWWKFGFPLFYVTDILQILESLAALGYGQDTRLSRALDLVREKQDEEGRWALEYDYTGKTWGSYGKKNQPNPWVTLRALRVLKAVG